MDDLIEKIHFTEDVPFNMALCTIKEYPIHVHNNALEVLLVVKGEIEFCVACEVFTMKKDDLILVDTNVIHHIKALNDENTILLLHIDFGRIQDIDNTIYMAFICEPLNSPINETNIIKGLIAEIFCLINRNDLNSQNKSENYNSLINSLISILINNFTILDYHHTKDNLTPFQINRFFHINKYIYENCFQQLNLQDIAQKFCLTEPYVSQLIRNVSSYSFQEILSYTRVEKSLPLLLNTSLNINRVAEESGFSDAKYYYKHFERWSKCTPSDYRRKYKMYVGREKKCTEIEYENVKTELKNYMDTPAYKNFMQNIDYHNDQLTIKRSYRQIWKRYLEINDLSDIEKLKSTFSTPQKNVGLTYGAINFENIADLSEQEIKKYIDIIRAAGLTPCFSIPYVENRFLSVNHFIKKCTFIWGQDEIEKWQFILSITRL